MRKLRKILGWVNILCVLGIIATSIYLYVLFPLLHTNQLNLTVISKGVEIPFEKGSQRFNFTDENITIIKSKSKLNYYLTIREKGSKQLKSYFPILINGEEVHQLNPKDTIIQSYYNSYEVLPYSPEDTSSSNVKQNRVVGNIYDYLKLETLKEEYNSLYATELNYENVEIEEIRKLNQLDYQLNAQIRFMCYLIMIVSVALFLINAFLNQKAKRKKKRGGKANALWRNTNIATFRRKDVKTRKVSKQKYSKRH